MEAADEIPQCQRHPQPRATLIHFAIASLKERGVLLILVGGHLVALKKARGRLHPIAFIRRSALEDDRGFAAVGNTESNFGNWLLLFSFGGVHTGERNQEVHVCARLGNDLHGPSAGTKVIFNSRKVMRAAVWIRAELS
jgi:hypothetical protein